MHRRFFFPLLFTILAAADLAVAEQLPPCPSGSLQDVSGFVDSRIQAILKAQIQQKNNTNQTQVPSVSTNSPSLVDESSASDLVGLAVNLLGISSESTDNTSTSATVSAYALKAALGAHDPLEPEYYNANSDWRRLSFTFGADFPEDSNNPQAERGVIVGGKYLLYNQRDITKDHEFGPRVEAMLRDVGQGVIAAVEDPTVDKILSAAMCTRPDGDFIDESKIDPTALEEIDNVIQQRASAALQYQQKAADLAREVNERPQVAFTFLTNQRQGDATSEYKGSLTADLGWRFDLGFADTMAFTFNGSYVFDDKPADQKDSQGGKVAAKLRLFQSPARLDQRVPWTLSLASDAAWKTHNTPEYRVQTAVTIALWDGVDLPLSVSWANQTEFVDEEQVIGNIGFTVDTAKLIARLR